MDAETPSSRAQASIASEENAPTQPSDDIAGSFDQRLVYVIDAAASIGALRRGTHSVTFTSLLLAALLCDDPDSRVFLDIAKRRGVDIDAISRHIGQELPVVQKATLNSARLGVPLATVATASAVEVLKNATQIAKAEGLGTGISVRHLIAAYIFQAYRAHEAELRLYKFDRESLGEHFAVAMTHTLSRTSFWNGYLDHIVRVGRVASILTNDVASTNDALSHSRFAVALAKFLCHSETKGPVSISIQAPWGAGKSSLMRQLRNLLDAAEVDRLDARSLAGEMQAELAEPRLEVREVLSFLNRKRPHSGIARAVAKTRAQRWTVWFNAWKYESSEQIWAGLVDAIVTQVSDRLGPVERELFLLRLNLARIDDGAVRKKIYERVATFWWGKVRRWVITAGAAVVSLLGAAAVAPPTSHENFPLNAEFLMRAGILVQTVAALYLVVQYFSASREVNKEPASFSLTEYLRVPDYAKSVGVVHQIHDDLQRILKVLPADRNNLGENIPRPLVIFIDDLDRCSPDKVAKVVEGVNMFLASDFKQFMFVIGMDPQVVAVALEEAHKEVRGRLPAYEHEAPLGWRFMDKFIQLPFTIPPSGRAEIEKYLDSLIPRRDLEATQGREPNSPTNESPNQVGVEPRSNLTEAIDKEASPLDHSEELLAISVLDEGAVIYESMREMALNFSINPREIKRLLNLVRFHLLLRDERERAGQPVATVGQLQRWIMLTLRWPDMVRWLQWGSDQAASTNVMSSVEPVVLTNRISRRLKEIEDTAGVASDATEFYSVLSDRFGDAKDGVTWFRDSRLYDFFKQGSLVDGGDRLSTGASLGYY